MAHKPTSMAAGNEEESLKAAKEELEILDQLARGVSAQIADLSRRSESLGRLDNNELALIANRYSRLKAYEELAHACYGRTVIGTEVDENDRPKTAFTYRITQANVGFVEKGCFVLARNTPLASGLVTAQPGEERDVSIKGGDRYFSVGEIRNFDGPVSLRSPSEEPNFRSMAIRRIGQVAPAVVEDLRSFVLRRLSADSVEELVVDVPREEYIQPTIDDPIWLTDWSGIYLGDSDEQTLSHQFFTRTTAD